MACNRFAKFRVALGRPVMRPAFIQCRLCGVHDVVRRFEVRFSDLEVNYALALRFQSASAHQYLECRLDEDPVHPFGEFHIFRKKGTPAFSSISSTRSSMHTGVPLTRPVTRPPLSSVTMTI